MRCLGALSLGVHTSSLRLRDPPRGYESPTRRDSRVALPRTEQLTGQLEPLLHLAPRAQGRWATVVDVHVPQTRRPRGAARREESARVHGVAQERAGERRPPTDAIPRRDAVPRRPAPGVVARFAGVRGQRWF